jgi:saccharopine dehydrogenase-like NADP-dependent oxidoreductase
MGYKFSWSPVGAMRAGNNPAVFIKDGQKTELTSQQLMYRSKVVELNPALELETYANRDSLKYQDLYGLKDCQLIMRGTLRYRGYTWIINSYKELGIFTEEPVEPLSWREYIALKLKGVVPEGPFPARVEEKLAELGDSVALMRQVLWKCVSVNPEYKGQAELQEKVCLKLVRAYKYYDLLSASHKLDPKLTSIENLTELLNLKMKLQEGETDMVAMIHLLKVRRPNGRVENIKSSMVLIGDKKGHSAVSWTVGCPTAIGTHLLLDGKIAQKGVVIPLTKEIYTPILH